AVNVYVCAIRLLNVPDVDSVPTFYTTLFRSAPVPPLALTTTFPLLPPLHVTLVTAGATKLTAVGWVTIAVVVAVHPAASVAVNVYVCAMRLLQLPNGDGFPTLGLIE